MDPITTSIAEAAKALGIGRTSVYALIKQGRLEIVKIGSRTLVKVDSIRRLVSAQA